MKLSTLGINTPAPIGYIEFYKNFLFKESFFIAKSRITLLRLENLLEIWILKIEKLS